ncbi:hypothetical protein D3C71_1095530 [compost metagenome]
MSYVSHRISELQNTGFFSATSVDPLAISKIINMSEFEYYDMDINTIESYLGLLAQQIYYVQQEGNIAAAREIEMGNDYKIAALPHVLQSKIRSAEERWIFASTRSPELGMKFQMWQQSVIDARLKKDLAEPITEKLQVLKKIYDDKRMEGRNRNNHKYIDGSFGRGEA